MHPAFCGNDCAACPRFSATQSGPAALEQVAQIWEKAGWREPGCDPRTLACSGCHRGMACRYGITACLGDRGVDTCRACKDFPCARLTEAFARAQAYAKQCRSLFSQDIYGSLEKAFFRKKENLGG